MEYTPQADGAGWHAKLVEKPNGCLVVAEGRSVNQARKRIREALAAALEDEEAATAAELVERFRLPEAKACESIRKGREQLEKALRFLELEAADLARSLRNQGYGPRDIENLLGKPEFLERGPSRASLREIPPMGPDAIVFGRGRDGLKKALEWARTNRRAKRKA